MAVEWQALSAVKHGNRPYENEDAIRPHIERRRFTRRKEFRCAISDGATQSAFAGMWADLLVHQAQTFPLSSRNLRTAVHRAQQQWWEHLSRRELAWNVEWKVRQGAHATLACLNLRVGEDASQGGTWSALAVGDSCMFQVRESEFVYAFPVAASADFTNYPHLVCSLEESNEPVWCDLSHAAGAWTSGDEFLLMTDALAQWFLHELEVGNRPVQEMRDLVRSMPGRQAAFADWLDALRSAKRIRNDDTTLGWAQVMET